ncbi:MAG: 30S ribosomal protein S12 methylthiotransferase RimO [Desulfovibrionaceae bacterium]|nr:30S ribosomal protein S12 methylthiotransferase RimO [Desulfovibrionaceae bacterium]MBF0515288.1 30S ribosomal protein S12 methylthiotransferase RimO [Desulfovibrionaceae bacterium]
MIKIHAISLGCPKNRVDTERLLGLAGAVAVEDLKDAEVVLINTCGFIRPAVEESLAAIFEAVQAIGELETKPLLTVAGCLVSRYGEELAGQIGEADIWLSTREIELWPEKLAKALGRGIAPGGERLVSTPPGTAYLKISEGCGHKCAFCAIPSIRGSHVSRAPGDILREGAWLLDRGARELVVVAQDTTAWGRDLPGKRDLRHLLEGLLALDGLAWLRLMYLYPAGLSDELLGFMRQAGPRLLPYFDIPLQHASPEILAAMGRPFARDPRLVIERVRRHFPEAALRTSLIVGFPGEKPHHFKELAEFVAAARFHHLGVFTYHKEDGTRAALLPGQVGAAVKERRRAQLMELQAGISEEILEGYVGAELDVLVDAPHPEWPGLHVGRAWFQAPEADGVTYISGPGVAPGAMVRAVIEEAKTYDLVALA